MERVRPYLDTPTKPKHPVGKVAGTDAHTYNGSHVMHILIEQLEDKNGKTVKSWVLKCKPAKKGVYSYMGFRTAVTCQRCKAGRGVKLDEAD
jgi:hypothetical protein